MEPSEKLNELSNKVIGSAIEVHKHLGPGYLESIYEESLAFELTKLGIQFKRQVEIPVVYKGHNVGSGRLDILIESELIIELKSTERILPLYQAQVISYLKTTGLILGLLINFNTPVLKQGIKRIVYSK
jgi:GxxExxY protein